MKTFYQIKVIRTLVSAVLSAMTMTSVVHAASFFTDFEGINYPVDEGLTDTPAGDNGWFTNDPYNNITFTGGTDAVINYGGSQVGQLGGIYLPDLSGTSNVVISNTLVSPADAFYGIKVSLGFAILDSSDTLKRDGFGFSLSVGGIEYAALLFTPIPGDVLEISLRGAGSPIIETSNFVAYNALLGDLVISIDQFNNLTAAINGVGLFGGAVDIDPLNTKVLTNIDQINVLYDVTGAPNDTGSNSIVFDNVSVVPEPSTVGLCILAGVGGLGLVIRRRKTT